MSIEAGSLPYLFLCLMFLPALAVLACAFWAVSWRALKSHTNLQHIFYLCCLALAMMWSLRAGITSGMEMHFLGLTLATLLMGWPLALICGALAMLAISILGVEPFAAYGVNFLVGVALPVYSSQRVLSLMQRYLPANPFVYIFIGGFFNGAIAMLCVASASSLMLVVLGVYSWSTVYEGYYMYLPLMIFPEAFINGTLVATIIGTSPEILSSFDMDRYFNDD